jgi:hypothetical protein
MPSVLMLFWNILILRYLNAQCVRIVLEHLDPKVS